MSSLRYFLSAILFFASGFSVTAQMQHTGNKEDSIAQSKVIELLESKHVLSYYDDDLNTPGDFIYSSQIETFIRQRPGADLNDYWIQVKDHRRYEGNGVSFNFYVNPESWEVLFFDPETNLTWTWEQWVRQNRNSKS
jgi:hypothetical protein